MCYKVCIFQTGIGLLEVYLVNFQSLRKLDCLQIITKSLFSLKNKNLKNDNDMWDLWRGLVSEIKLPGVKVFNTTTQLDEHVSLSSLFTQNIYNDFFKLCQDRPTISLSENFKALPHFLWYFLFSFVWCHIWT